MTSNSQSNSAAARGNTAPARVLLVDVDGTLMDSYPGIRASFVHALEQHGVSVPPEEELRKIPGPPMAETLASMGLEGQLHDDVFNTYLDHQENGGWTAAQPFTGMVELLEAWKNAGFVLSTATSKSEVSAQRVLAAHGMLEFFDVLAAAQEQGPRRSKAQVIAYALDQLEKLGVDRTTAATSMLLIGDRVHDVEGAAEFGIPTVLVDWGYGTTQERNQATYRAGNTEELAAIVSEHFMNLENPDSTNSTSASNPEPAIQSVTVVCTGNICRSPMGEVVLRDACRDAGLNVSINSCGLGGWHEGDQADHRTIDVLTENGLGDLAQQHRAAEFATAHDHSELYLAMDDSHVRGLRRLGVSPEKIHLFRNFDPDAPRNSPVEDPYYGSRSDFVTVYEQIVAATPGIVAALREGLPDRQA